jgi:hypothetical protein
MDPMWRPSSRPRNALAQFHHELKQTPTLSFNPDASPAALMRRPLGAG